MKNYTYILYAVLVLSSWCHAQKVSLTRTNTLFSNQAYVEAAASYELQERSKEVLTNLADAYYYMGDYAKAEKTYTELTAAYGAIENRDCIYRYAHALQASNKYEEADTYLKQYYGAPFDTKLFTDELNQNRPYVYQVADIKNTGTAGDFGLRFTGANQVIFASSRNTDRPAYSWNGLPYLDVFTGTLKDANTLSNVMPVTGDVNTNVHESNAVITKDGKTMYFNRNSAVNTNIDGKKVKVQRLFKAQLVDGLWTNITPLPFASTSFSTQHATLSPDEDMLYFTSDMPGGFGKLDIYKSTINKDGSYGLPINLGASVNTAQLDQFPYISDNNTLYYSSNGKPGYGGLDIFQSEFKNGSFLPSMNLGNEINTAYDDHSYIVNETTNTGYLTSSKSGIDKLYSFKRKENILSKFLVEGFVKDITTGDILPGALVVLMDKSGRVLQDTIVDRTGKYNFRVENNSMYVLRGAIKGYSPSEESFTTNEEGVKSKNILLSLESYAVTEARIRENEKGEIMVKLEKIYFDYNKSDIRKDATIVLNELVRIMNKFPEMKVEVSAHTDARGPNEYNLDLSKRRAASVMEYLISQEIDVERLRSIGYGEEQPLNECFEDTECTEAQYELNRRCEFKLID